MTDDDIRLELETINCAEGGVLRTCPACKQDTYLTWCLICDKDLSRRTGDNVVDNLFDRVDRGEDVDMEELRGRRRPTTAEQWEPVTPREG